MVVSCAFLPQLFSHRPARAQYWLGVYRDAESWANAALHAVRILIDAGRLVEAEVLRLLDAKSYDFDLYMDLRDAETGRHPLQSAFGVKALPTKFLIDKEGIIRFRHTGYVAEQEGAAEIKMMVDMAN